MTSANFHRPLSRIRWRAGRVGMSRSEAVANAEAKLVEIKEAVLVDCDKDLSRLDLWAFGDEPDGIEDQNGAYEAAQNIAAIIGTFGYDALGRAAFGLCEQLSGEGRPGPAFDLAVKAHVAAMTQLREMQEDPALLHAVEGLASLRTAAALGEGPEVGALARVVFASLSTGAAGEFLADARALAAAIGAESQDLGITGLMLCHAGWFLHWIEGDPASLAKLYASLLLDGRQSRIKVLDVAGSPQRRFSAWRTVSAESGGAQAALLGQTRAGFSPHDLNPKAACALLEAFAALGEGAAAGKA